MATYTTYCFTLRLLPSCVCLVGCSFPPLGRLCALKVFVWLTHCIPLRGLLLYALVSGFFVLEFGFSHRFGVSCSLGMPCPSLMILWDDIWTSYWDAMPEFDDPLGWYLDLSSLKTDIGLRCVNQISWYRIWKGNSMLTKFHDNSFECWKRPYKQRNKCQRWFCPEKIKANFEGV